MREGIHFGNPETNFLASSRRDESALAARDLAETYYALSDMFRPQRSRESQINMDDFSDVYGKAEVQADKERVAEERKNHHEDGTLLGRFMEDLLANADKLKLFGEYADTAVWRASPYDDLFRHTDLIVEINESGEKSGALPAVTRFSVDITTGGEEVVARKTERIVRSLERGELGEAKYFQSEYDQKKRGRLQHIPNLLLEIEQERTMRFLEDVKPYIDARGKKITDREKFSKVFGRLAEELQVSLLKNAEAQASVLSQYAKKAGVFSQNESEALYAYINDERFSDAQYCLDEFSATRNTHPKRGIFIARMRTMLSVCGTLAHTLSAMKRKKAP